MTIWRKIIHDRGYSKCKANVKGQECLVFQKNRPEPDEAKT